MAAEAGRAVPGSAIRGPTGPYQAVPGRIEQYRAVLCRAMPPRRPRPLPPPKAPCRLCARRPQRVLPEGSAAPRSAPLLERQLKTRKTQSKKKNKTTVLIKSFHSGPGGAGRPLETRVSVSRRANNLHTQRGFAMFSPTPHSSCAPTPQQNLGGIFLMGMSSIESKIIFP